MEVLDLRPCNASNVLGRNHTVYEYRFGPRNEDSPTTFWLLAALFVGTGSKELGSSHRQGGVRIFDAHVKILMHGHQI